MRLRAAYLGGMWSEFKLELVRYIFRVCTCGTVFGLDSPSSVSCTCMCVCTAVGMCSPSVVPLVVGTCRRACTVYGMESLGGVRSIHECLCLYVRAVLLPLVQYFGMDSLGDAPILRRPACLGVHAVRVLTWTAWAAYVVYMSACAMFGMDSLGDAPIVRRPACLDSHAVLVHVQFMTWTTWAAYAVYMGACGCTYALCLYNVFGMDSPGRCTDCAYARVLGLARCTCTRTVFGMDSLSNARVVYTDA